MIPNIQHNFTNWVDGMKINRQHFVDSENALIDLARDANAVQVRSYSYGLLEPLAGEKTALACDVMNGQAQQFKIVVSHCRAITSGGNRIEILPGIHPELTNDNSVNQVLGSGANAYFAIIAIDPFARTPFGEATPDELPPRNKYSRSSLQLFLVPDHTIEAGSIGSNFLPIARFVYKNNELIKDAAYIPPCTTLAAHPGSRILGNTIAEYFENLMQSSIEVIQKVENNKDKQSTPLAKNVGEICKQICYHISNNFFKFRVITRQQSPVYLANDLYQLASVINATLNFLSVRDKEDVMAYCSQWINISPGKFQDLITGVINADYAHENMNAFFDPSLEFLATMIKMLDELKKLQLIGEKSRESIFTGVREEAPRKKSFFE